MGMHRPSADALRGWAGALLIRAGMEPERAAVVADVLVEGDLLGHDTHGLQLLAPYLDEIAAGDVAHVAALGQKAGEMSKSAFASPIKDFYLTNPIARASAVMAECSALARNNFQAAAE